jgi:hypothetical protein
MTSPKAENAMKEERASRASTQHGPTLSTFPLNDVHTLLEHCPFAIGANGYCVAESNRALREGQNLQNISELPRGSSMHG